MIVLDRKEDEKEAHPRRWCTYVKSEESKIETTRRPSGCGMASLFRDAQRYSHCEIPVGYAHRQLVEQAVIT